MTFAELYPYGSRLIYQQADPGAPINHAWRFRNGKTASVLLDSGGEMVYVLFDGETEGVYALRAHLLRNSLDEGEIRHETRS